MQLKREIMNVPFGVLLQRMSPTELAKLANEVIEQGLVKGKLKMENMKQAGISIESMGIN